MGRAVVSAGDNHLADIIHAGVARPVDLDDIHVLPGRDRQTGITFPARLRSRPIGILTIQRLGQNPGRAGLARPARPAEEIGMRNPPGFDGPLERRGDMILPNELIEIRGPIFSRQDGIRHRSNAV